MGDDGEEIWTRIDIIDGVSVRARGRSSAPLTACGSADTTASSLPTPWTTSPAASPSIIAAAEPVSRWDAQGSASLERTQAVARRSAAALTAEKIPKARLYTAAATWDYWATDAHDRGATAIEGIYRDAGAYLDWSKRSHLLTARGVAVYEGMLLVNGTDPTPSLSMLAVDGDKVTHEEIFLNEGMGRPVMYYGSAPGPKDTAKVAARVAAAVGDAFANGGRVALQALVAPDILSATPLRRTTCACGTPWWHGGTRPRPPRSATRSRSRDRAGL
jgi:hypothetical protein